MDVAIDASRMRRKRGHNRVFDINTIERAFGERYYSAVDANRRRRPRHEQQIASATGRQQPKPSLDSSQITSRRRCRPGRVELEYQSIDLVVVGHPGAL
jgi:hypothetical protein